MTTVVNVRASRPARCRGLRTNALPARRPGPPVRLTRQVVWPAESPSLVTVIVTARPSPVGVTPSTVAGNGPIPATDSRAATASRTIADRDRDEHRAVDLRRDADVAQTQRVAVARTGRSPGRPARRSERTGGSARRDAGAVRRRASADVRRGHPSMVPRNGARLYQRRDGVDERVDVVGRAGERRSPRPRRPRASAPRSRAAPRPRACRGSTLAS